MKYKKPRHFTMDRHKRIVVESKQGNIPIESKYLYVATFNTNKCKDLTWYVDIGATQHVAYDQNTFMTYKEWPKGPIVYLGDDTTQHILGQGYVAIQLCDGQQKEVPNVLHVLGLMKILFFVEQCRLVGGEMHIKKRHYNLKYSKGILFATYKLENGLYKLGISIQCHQLLPCLQSQTLINLICGTTNYII
jgi:hypothetical protein